MNRRIAQWWGQLRIQHKVWAVLLLLCVPLGAGLTSHLYTIQQLLALQHQRHELILAQGQMQLLRRLAVDIEDGFRGYLLTQEPAFLAPLTNAEKKIDQALTQTTQTMAGVPEIASSLSPIDDQLKGLLHSKQSLINKIQNGQAESAREYVRSGEGLKLSDRLRHELRTVEDRLEARQESLNDRTESLSKRTFIGLWIALGGVVILGWIGSRVLASSLTVPIARMHSATAQLAESVDAQGIKMLLAPALDAKDELGQLAVAYLDMAHRIETHIHEIDVLDTISHEINTIGPDGLEGVLRRITDLAVELVHADVCLVLLRNEQMGCWIVEAASGEWNDRLQKSVMLWEELPISVQAYEKRDVAIGEHFRSDPRPQVVRRNLIGDSMLAVPLLSQGVPFGVLALLCQQPRTVCEWNQRLAKGLAQAAALAISNARLYEAAQQRQKSLLARLRQLEYLAETLAHDLKGPGQRIEELVKLLAQKFSGQVDERTAKWLKLIQDNGSDIVRRVEGILEVAHVGADHALVTAVDPRLIIDDVLKAWAGEIERLQAIIHVEPGFPLVACHSAYLRQVFDNLVSNALKYARPGEPPVVTISYQAGKHMVCFTVHDQGIGVPAEQRSRIFQPFVRLGRIEAAGSGIGLTIVQRIVELYGGRVWIEETDREGCTVKFTIPSLSQEINSPHLTASDTAFQEVVNMPSSDLT